MKKLRLSCSDDKVLAAAVWAAANLVPDRSR